MFSFHFWSIRFHTITCHAQNHPEWSSQADHWKFQASWSSWAVIWTISRWLARNDWEQQALTRHVLAVDIARSRPPPEEWFVTGVKYQAFINILCGILQYTVFWWTYWIYATLREARKKQTNQRKNHVELESLMFHPAQAIVAIQQVLLQMFEWFLGVEFLRCSFCLVYTVSICFSNCLMSIVFNLPNCFWLFLWGSSHLKTGDISRSNLLQFIRKDVGTRVTWWTVGRHETILRPPSAWWKGIAAGFISAMQSYKAGRDLSQIREGRWKICRRTGNLMLILCYFAHEFGKTWPKINRVKFMQHRMLKIWSAWRMWTDHKPGRSLRMTRRHEGDEICRCSWSTVDMYVKCAGAIWNHFWDCGILAAFGTSLRLRWVSKTLLGGKAYSKLPQENVGTKTNVQQVGRHPCRQHSPGDAFFRCIECSNKRLGV